MVSLYNINLEGAYDGQQRHLEDFRFDLENVLTISQLVGKPAEERNAASVNLGILASTRNKTAAEVASAAITDPSRLSGQKGLYAVLAAKTSGRAEEIVRGDKTKNGACAWARLQERFGRDSGMTSFTEVFQCGWPKEKPFEDVWREWVKKVSKLPQGSVSSQAIEQVTISGLSRHGQSERENHLRLRAPMAWQDVQTQVEKYLSTIDHDQSPQPVDIGAATTSQKCQSCGRQTHKRSECWDRDETCKTCRRRGHLAKVCRSGHAQQSRTNSPDNVRKGTGRGFTGKVKGKGKKHPPEKCLCCGEEGHRKADCKFKNTSCAICGKVGPLKAMCRNTNTHEIEQNEDGPSPEVTVEDVCCMAVRDVVKDGHCNCTEYLETSEDPRKFIMNIENGQDPGYWSRRSRWMNKVHQLRDEGEDKDKFVAIALTDHIIVRNYSGDAATDQSMSQAKTVLESSEQVACQMKIQEKVETTLLFNTGADAHVIPKWEQLGEPTLQSTSVTLKGAKRQDLGAIGEVLVKGFIGKVNVQFKAVVA